MKPEKNEKQVEYMFMFLDKDGSGEVIHTSINACTRTHELKFI
jgi:hypothetical protein